MRYVLEQLLRNLSIKRERERGKRERARAREGEKEKGKKEGKKKGRQGEEDNQVDRLCIQKDHIELNRNLGRREFNLKGRSLYD